MDDEFEESVDLLRASLDVLLAKFEHEAVYERVVDVLVVPQHEEKQRD